MADFLDVLEQTRVDANNVKAVFTRESGDGVPAKRAALRIPNYKYRLAEAAKLLANIMRGKTHPAILKEVMTTDDFPYLFGDIIDRQTLAVYQDWPDDWSGIARRTVVNDFKDVRLTPPILGADQVLEEVKEAAQYPDAALTEQAPSTWHVNKYGRRVPFTWEAMINDDTEQLRDIPRRLGIAARRTESSMVTAVYVSSTGPNATLYHNDYGNIINVANGALTNNPALTIAGLQDAYRVLNSMLDEQGYPILRTAVTLVVPPALEVVANNIVEAVAIWANAETAGGVPGNGTTIGQQMLQVNNWMRNRLTVKVNPYLPLVATTNGNTSWYLFANPNDSREAIRIGFLRGHEAPEIWMKSPNAVRVGGGGLVNPFDGDFDTDSIEYKVRHVLGVAQIDPKATVASNGTGS